jgi:eukaryotic-like serine/threonine-protein kinase
VARSQTDRNLLFGILALQMDLVTRDQLVVAMNAWVLRKADPLAQVLVDQGALAADERALLEPMVALHLKRHGDDPERSLQAARRAILVLRTRRRCGQASRVTPQRR